MTSRLAIVIPTLDAGEGLGRSLDALADAEAAGLRTELVVVDGGSRDGTVRCALAGGARVVRASPGRGGQLAAGAAATTGAWLLFLHADTRLEAGWAQAAARFMGEPAITRRVSRPGWKRWKATWGYMARRVGTALSKRPPMRLLRPCMAP